MATLKVFYSKSPTTGYVFQSGRAVHFVNHKYATDNAAEIKELTIEASSSESNYYIDDNKKEMDSSELDPIAVIKANALIQARAEVAAATAINRDMGATDQNVKLSGIANTSDLNGAGVLSGTAQQNVNTPSAVAVKIGSVSVATATKV